MENDNKDRFPVEGKWFDRCLIALLVATLAVNLLSAYIRHSEAGLGCAPWPGCYATIGALVDPSAAGPAAVLTPAETAKQAHRAIATALVVLVLLVVYQARQRALPGTARQLPYLLVAVILFLSVIGPASYLKTMPAVATANLAGGMALLAISWVLWIRSRPEPLSGLQRHRWLAPLALVGLTVQILLGAWVSANFAGVACGGLLDCHPDGGLRSFWYLRELELDASGRIDMEAGQGLIALAHQLAGLVVAGLVIALGVAGLRAGQAAAAWSRALLGLVGVQVALGLSLVYAGLPLLVVLGHNLVAALLLLVCLRLVISNSSPSRS